MTATSDDRAPATHRNWRAKLDNIEGRVSFEAPLFTDVRVTGEIKTALGPYRVMNTTPKEVGLIARPALIVRVDGHIDAKLSNDAPLDSETDADGYHGGSFAEEIAALLSLRYGIRLKAGGVTRTWFLGDPLGEPHDASGPSLSLPLYSMRSPILPSALEPCRLDEDALLSTYPAVDAASATALLKSARRYQDALWIAESLPQLAWLLLVSAIETAANGWAWKKDSAVARLRSLRPELASRVRNEGNDALELFIARELAPSLRANRKFLDFLALHRPPPLSAACTDLWIDEAFEAAMKRIYEWRSRALHDGIPFPAPMCLPPARVGDEYTVRPPGDSLSTHGGSWADKDTPMLLHVFEHIVRRSLISWWERLTQVPTTQSQR
jgi:hypothetical protein